MHTDLTTFTTDANIRTYKNGKRLDIDFVAVAGQTLDRDRVTGAACFILPLAKGDYIETFIFCSQGKVSVFNLAFSGFKL